jgi:hypothetical protein
MKCVNEIQKLVEHVAKGEMEIIDGVIKVWAPVGYTWESSGSRLIARMGEDILTGQRFYKEACADVWEDVLGGLRKCTDKEREEIEHESGELWEAPAGAPDFIVF